MGFIENLILQALAAQRGAQAPPPAIPVTPPKKKKGRKRRDEAGDAIPMAELPVSTTRRLVEDVAVPATAASQPPPAARHDLRRMFVLAEILGPPLALRQDGDALGPA